MYLYVWCTHENICFIQKIKYSRTILQLLPPPPPLHMCTQEWRQPRKNQKYYIGTRLDNNTVHVQQQTPFRNVKSPESPKHRKERVMAWRGRGSGDGVEGAGLWRDDFHYIMIAFGVPNAVFFQNDQVFPSHAARGQVAQWEIPSETWPFRQSDIPVHVRSDNPVHNLSHQWDKRVAFNVLLTCRPDTLCPLCPRGREAQSP